MNISRQSAALGKNTTFRPAHLKLNAGKRLILIVLLMFLSTEVFQGPLRYFFNLLGVSSLIYVPKLLAVTALIALVFNAARTLYFHRPLLIGLFIFTTFLIVGMWYANSLLQPLFGAFALLPLLLGIMAEPACFRFGSKHLLPYAVMLWLCVAGGVVYDYFTIAPWSGLNYQLGDQQIEGARQWTAFGVERISGFSRASFNAANQLLFLALFFVVLGKRKMVALIVWVATGLFIAITTTKTAFGVYAFLTLLLPLMTARTVPRVIKNTVAVMVPVSISIIGILLPLSVLFFGYNISLEGHAARFIFSSFEDRLTRTWPDGLQLIIEHGNIITGRGIGGIGTAQVYFENNLYSSADSLYLYLYGTFGVISLLLVGIYVFNVCQLRVVEDRWARLMWFFSVAVLMSGWAVNGVEGPFIATILGITIAFSSRKRVFQNIVSFRN